MKTLLHCATGTCFPSIGSEQSGLVDDEDATSGPVVRGAVGDHLRAQHVGDADPRPTRRPAQRPANRPAVTARVHGAGERAHDDRGDPLDVVVEREQAVAVAVEDRRAWAVARSSHCSSVPGSSCSTAATKRSTKSA
jgi:hypothetical protein